MASIALKRPAQNRCRSNQALKVLDLPMIMATVLYASFFVVIANAVVDLLCLAIDPRMRRA